MSLKNTILVGTAAFTLGTLPACEKGNSYEVTKEAQEVSSKTVEVIQTPKHVFDFEKHKEAFSDSILTFLSSKDISENGYILILACVRTTLESSNSLENFKRSIQSSIKQWETKDLDCNKGQAYRDLAEYLTKLDYASIEASANDSIPAN